MPNIIFIEHSGTEHTLDLPVGTTLMAGAINNMVPGIEGDCGGLCACATCHIYLSEKWQKLCPEAEELESSMLDFAFEVNGDSRLACQIRVTEDFEGMKVQLPKRQY